ncbi:fatty acid hydroxylase superfamily-domain-containing protein [Hyaloraphidium curvatum]|nr:fatty acid hydroxylase superfamily-domain-containing protein [Hyaloraphidium curvatum]
MLNATVASAPLAGGAVPLTYLEEKWMSMFEGRNQWVVLTVFLFVMHESVYFLAALPYMISDCFTAMHRFKIQQNRENDSNLLWKCLKRILFNHFFIQLPMMIFFHPMAEMLGMEIFAPFPTWSTMAYQVAIFMVFEDFYHYWAHRALHNGIWYQKIHKIHHDFTSPFAITAEYAHPLETLILGFGTTGGPIIWVGLTGNLHIITLLTWVSVKILQALESHCGYDYPWSLRRWLPFWAGADHHDYHHMAFVGNFGSQFRWWDAIFGTDSGYRKWKEQQASAKAKSL